MKFTEVKGGILEVFDYNKCIEAGHGGLTLNHFCNTRYQKISVAGDGTFMIHKVNNIHIRKNVVNIMTNNVKELPCMVTHSYSIYSIFNT